MKISLQSGSIVMKNHIGTIMYGIIGIWFSFILKYLSTVASPKIVSERSSDTAEIYMPKLCSSDVWWKLLYKIPIGWIVMYPFFASYELGNSMSGIDNFNQTLYFLVRIPCYPLYQIVLDPYTKLYGHPKVGDANEHGVLLLSGIVSYYLLALIIMFLILLKRKYEKKT